MNYAGCAAFQYLGLFFVFKRKRNRQKPRRTAALLILSDHKDGMCIELNRTLYHIAEFKYCGSELSEHIQKARHPLVYPKDVLL